MASTTTTTPTTATTPTTTATAATSMTEDMPEAELSVAVEDTPAVGDASKAPDNRVYIRAGSFSRSPSKLPKIKETVLDGVESVSAALARICGSEEFDLAIVYTASSGHLHHTVRVAARNASKFSATLHIDLQGNVSGKDGKKEPFKNGGRKGEGSCDFDRALFQAI